MSTLDALTKLIDKSRDLAMEYDEKAKESKEDEELHSFLQSLAKQEYAQVEKLKSRISHLLEKEDW